MTLLAWLGAEALAWSAYRDGYCERTAPGLVNEPLNVLSNAAFFAVAAWAVGAGRRADRAVKLLSWLVAAIGAGSLAFHAFATRWAMAADVLPITLFIYAYLGLALRRFLDLGRAAAALGLGCLAAINLAVAAIPTELSNGSLAYAPALLAGLAVAVILKVRRHPAWRPLAGAATLFTVSLAVRSLDLSLCDSVPFGTHFLWHILNAAVLALYLDAAIRFGSAPVAIARKELAPEAMPSGAQSWTDVKKL